ncbi:GATA zinc finger domain-containing protein 1-like [Sycon ciliatum]|uniref:GATA zinc finger domain-containing protein 1-like n=1 Tax=Sycon ciliatum TaxID=27933 RepID=UPI0020AAF59B|eukprot:scpid81280/ scgid21189/ GATA zinc finger domain-containing protein 1
MPLGFKPCCADCKVFESPMWHKAGNGDVLCHACSNQGPQVHARVREEKLGMSLRCRERLTGPKGKMGAAKGEYKSSRVRNQQNRRTMMKSQPVKGLKSSAALYASESVQYDGMTYRIGDVVSILDVEGGIYYAQIRGFLRDQYAESFAVLTWLLPTQPDPVHFDMNHFRLGPEEETPRPMSVLKFVCHFSLDKSSSGCSWTCCQPS